MKDIFLCMAILSFLFNISSAKDNNFSSVSVYKKYYKKLEEKKQTNEYEKGAKTKKIIDYIPLKINFDKDEVKKVYERWKKYNTGTYVYICSSTTLRNLEIIIFIYQNKVVNYMQFSEIQNRNAYKIHTDINLEKTILTRNNRFFRSANNVNYYLMDGRFKELSISSENLEYYDCSILDVLIDKKYNYLSAIEFKKIYNKICKSRPKPKDKVNQWHIYSYGFLMLPKGTEYTDKVVEKILNKYEQAWKCEKKLLTSKKINDEQNLTLLEKAIGKEKLECLDKYLIWDEDESK